MREHGANTKHACLATPVSVGSRGARRWLAGRLAVLCLGVLLAACQMRLSNVAEPSTPPSENPAGETLPVAPPTPVIPVAEEAATVTVEPTALTVAEGGAATYLVMLGSEPTGDVTITPVPSAELLVQPTELTFTTADWGSAQTVTVSAVRDTDAVADPPGQVTHTVRGGGYDDATASVSVIIVEADVATLAVDSAHATEQAGGISFMVTLSRAVDRVVSAHYDTGGTDDSADAGTDYASTTGTLSFAARSTGAQTIEVVVHDDELDEDDEFLTVTLSDANAPLAGGEATLAVTGRIDDDDLPPHLGIDDASLDEGDGAMSFAVGLESASGLRIAVGYATADQSATAAADYEAVSGTLTFPAGTTVQSITVPIVDDQDIEEPESFTVTLTLGDPDRATLTDATANGEIIDNDVEPLQLSSLEVTGGGSMYPEFDADTYHYGATCNGNTTLRVQAAAKRSGASLTLLAADPVDNLQAVGSLDVEVSAHAHLDVAIELSDAGETAMYLVHCRPADFTGVKVLKKLDDASEGLLILTPQGKGLGNYYSTLLDYNGVPRLIIGGGYNFRPYPNGPTIDGKKVRYGAHKRALDEDFELIRTVDVVAPLTSANGHDFVITDRGFLFISYHGTSRDLSGLEHESGDPLPTEAWMKDSVIQEVAPDGTELFRWNSWDHLDVLKAEDCLIVEKYLDGRTEYGHLNSLQIADGDIIASFRGCAQVLRIDRSSGAVEWKLGGTPPDPDSAHTHAYLPLVDDPAGEFCGQHHVTLTAADTVVLFDNGVQCLGPRKNETPFSRVVEYDISSGTQAVFMREYRRPAEQGHSQSRGGVTVVNDGDNDSQNDRWVISWGIVMNETVGLQQLVALSEVDPGTPGTNTSRSLFEASMYKSGHVVHTYRLYHQPESAVKIPLSLP